MDRWFLQSPARCVFQGRTRRCFYVTIWCSTYSRQGAKSIEDNIPACICGFSSIQLHVGKVNDYTWIQLSRWLLSDQPGCVWTKHQPVLQLYSCYWSIVPQESQECSTYRKQRYDARAAHQQWVAARMCFISVGKGISWTKFHASKLAYILNSGVQCV